MLRTRRLSPTARRMIAIVSFSVIAIGLLVLFRPKLEQGSFSVAVPLLHASNSSAAAFISWPHFFRTKAALVAENAKLKDDVRRSENSVLDRNQLYEENLALKERLGREAAPDAAFAAVLMRPPEVPYDTLLIDIGADSGIKEGDRVAAQGTLLIGKVTDVYAHTARVTLFSSPGSAYQGFLRGTIPIEVQGQGGGSLSMSVPYDAHVQAGDTVSLPGLEPNVASVVEYVKPGQGDSAVTAFLRLPVNSRELKFVDVWRSR
jgi:cell shape-determining protein MreC